MYLHLNIEYLFPSYYISQLKESQNVVLNLPALRTVFIITFYSTNGTYCLVRDITASPVISVIYLVWIFDYCMRIFNLFTVELLVF